MDQKIIILVKVKLSVSNKINMQRICFTSDFCEEVCGAQPRACETLQQNRSWECVEHRQTSLELQWVVMKCADCLTRANVWVVLVELYFCVH